MKDCSNDMLKYHTEEVTLPTSVQGTLRGNRNANRDRLKRGLDKNGHPQPDAFIIQGSYAMKTMKQHPKNDYDIDDGAAFAEGKLTDADGMALTPLQARERVRDALLAGGGLPATPELKTNCVRIKYAAGHHVDIPVYRIRRDQFGNESKEIASGDEWRESNPNEITDWFRGKEKATQQDGEAEPQLRRLVRLLKTYSCNNQKEASLCGLILTVLAAEQHTYYDGREDRAFRNLIERIRMRLHYDKAVLNPADLSEELTKDRDLDKITKLIDRISASMENLRILDDPECSQAEAREAWDEVFVTDFFSDLQAVEQSSKAPATPSDSYPDKRVNIQGPSTAA